MITTADLLDVAQAAYGPADVESNICHAVIRQYPGCTAVGFRGTDPHSMLDLLRDMDALHTFDPVLGSVHDGFLDDVLSIAWRLVPSLPASNIYVTGHSKGGAEALIFSAMLAYLDRPPVLVTTFGSACPGALPLAAALPGIDYRHGTEPVPLLPLDMGRPRALAVVGTGGGIDAHYLTAYRAAVLAAETSTMVIPVSA